MCWRTYYYLFPYKYMQHLHSKLHIYWKGRHPFVVDFNIFSKWRMLIAVFISLNAIHICRNRPSFFFFYLTPTAIDFPANLKLLFTLTCLLLFLSGRWRVCQHTLHNALFFHVHFRKMVVEVHRENWLVWKPPSWYTEQKINTTQKCCVYIFVQCRWKCFCVSLLSLTCVLLFPKPTVEITSAYIM